MCPSCSASSVQLFYNPIAHLFAKIGALNHSNSRSRFPEFWAVCWVRVEKLSLLALAFKYFRQSKENHGPSTFRDFALRLYNCYNHAHWPGQHMWPSPGPWARLQVLQNSGGRMFMLRVKPVSARLTLTKSKKEKITARAVIWKHAC